MESEQRCLAHWQNGEIVEEKLFYDLMSLLKQIGVMGEESAMSQAA